MSSIYIALRDGLECFSKIKFVFGTDASVSLDKCPNVCFSVYIFKTFTIWRQPKPKNEIGSGKISP